MNQMTQQQREAMKKALHNPLIIKEITQRAKFEQLKNYREINSEWKLFSNEVIVNISCVRLRWTENEDPFHKTSDPNLTLRQLTDLLDRSPNFPTSHFILTNVGKLGHAFDLFSSHGSKIKKLKLTCGTPVTNSDSTTNDQICFYSMLNQLLPNLHDLKIVNFENLPNWSTLLYNFSLPSLKSFGFRRADETARKIIQSSPNLESITTVVSSALQLEMVTLENKIQTMRSFYVSLHVKSETLASFVRGRAHLRKLSFSSIVNNRELVPAFNALLDTHKDKLEKLDLSDICSLPNIKIPILKRLKRLVIGTPVVRQCLPHGVNLSEIFPNLRILNCLKVACQVDTTYDGYFPQSTPVIGTLPSVDSLIVDAGVTPLWMVKLWSLCPNFKMLSSIDHRYNPELFAMISHWWSHVESLVLIMGNPNRTMDSFDPIFTGFCANVCNRLSAAEATLGEREKDFEQLQVRPAIYDLTSLKKLKVKLVLSREDVKNCYIPISHLSGLYGFSRLPSLKVSIQVCTHEDDVIAATKLVRDKLGLYADVQFPNEKCFM